MARTVDVGVGCALEAHRDDLLSTADPLGGWVAEALGHRPRDLALFRRAFTHPSLEGADYQRLEFLGDRVLGLCAAAWLFELYPQESEGNLSRRLNALVAGETCAAIAREIGVAPLLRLGKQARDDGAQQSDNVLGDVVEALIGALFLEGGLDAARGFVRRAWADRVSGQHAAPKHPKSALQEWAAAHGAKPPVYTLAGRSGAHHAPLFRVRVAIPDRAEADAEAEGSSKQEAETAAARALMEKLG